MPGTVVGGRGHRNNHVLAVLPSHERPCRRRPPTDNGHDSGVSDQTSGHRCERLVDVEGTWRIGVPSCLGPLLQWGWRDCACIRANTSAWWSRTYCARFPAQPPSTVQVARHVVRTLRTVRCRLCPQLVPSLLPLCSVRDVPDHADSDWGDRLSDRCPPVGEVTQGGRTGRGQRRKAGPTTAATIRGPLSRCRPDSSRRRPGTFARETHDDRRVDDQLGEPARCGEELVEPAAGVDHGDQRRIGGRWCGNGVGGDLVDVLAGVAGGRQGEPAGAAG